MFMKKSSRCRNFHKAPCIFEIPFCFFLGIAPWATMVTSVAQANKSVPGAQNGGAGLSAGSVTRGV